MAICPKCGPTSLIRRECARHGYIPYLTPRQPVPKGEPVILRFIPREALTDPEAPSPNRQHQR